MLQAATALKSRSKILVAKVSSGGTSSPHPTARVQGRPSPKVAKATLGDASNCAWQALEETATDQTTREAARAAAAMREAMQVPIDVPIDRVPSYDPAVPESPATQEPAAHDIAALYERHAPAIYAHCRRLLGSAPAGRDALQESFVRVLQHHRVLGPGDQALRYLYRTSTNVCINLLRQRSVRERAAPLIAAQIKGAQSCQPVPGDREFVRMLLEQCDETAVAVALMHFVDGMTQVEVAATLGITRRTVYNRIRRIERLAADLLGPELPVVAAVAELTR